MNLKIRLKKLSILSLPIIMGQIGQMLIGAGDVYIASLFSTQAVGAVGVANSVINPIFLFSLGLMFGISPCLSIKRGEDVPQRGLLCTMVIYGFMAGVFATLSGFLVNLNIQYFGLDPHLVPLIKAYNWVVCFSFPFSVIYQALREYLQSHEEVIAANSVSVICVVLNLIINYVLVFGFQGWEGIGFIGLAYASLITRILMALFMFIIVLRRESLKSIDWSLIKELFKFGYPIAFSFFFEVLAFCVVGMLSGKLGVVEAATNNIILTIAATTFMIPMSIGSAVSVKIGHALGQKNLDGIRGYAASALTLVMAYMLLTTLMYILIPQQLLMLMTNDTQVIELGVKVFAFVAAFQLADCIQVAMAGILRGLKFMNQASLAIFIGYWFIGIPFGLYLTFVDNYGLVGLWIGLTISLTVVAIALSVFFAIKYKGFKTKWLENVAAALS